MSNPSQHNRMIAEKDELAIQDIIIATVGEPSGFEKCARSIVEYLNSKYGLSPAKDEQVESSRRLEHIKGNFIKAAYEEGKADMGITITEKDRQIAELKQMVKDLHDELFKQVEFQGQKSGQSKDEIIRYFADITGDIFCETIYHEEEDGISTCSTRLKGEPLPATPSSTVASDEVGLLQKCVDYLEQRHYNTFQERDLVDEIKKYITAHRGQGEEK